MERTELEQFVASRYRSLVRFGFALTLDVQEAEDLAQTALMRCYPRWRTIDDPDAYVRSVMARAAYRRRRVPQPVHDVPEPPPVGDASADVLDRHVVVAALASLPRRQRAVIVMRYMEDLSDAAIAATLHVHVGTVRSQAARALDKLRAMPVFAKSEEWRTDGRR